MLSAADLADRLARHAEAVCRHYLSAGRRSGNYWIVGDTANNKGRSLYVRLTGARAGRWSDAATGQYGDLLDLIRETCALLTFADVAQEARRFLALPRLEPLAAGGSKVNPPGSRLATERAGLLFASARPIAGTLAERYFQSRGILGAAGHQALRFHPSCYYRDLTTGNTMRLPAMIAAVMDAEGRLTGVHRTFLRPEGDGKAKVEEPRRALGRLLGNAIRFNMQPHAQIPILAAGEGIETVLSLSCVLRGMPMVAALSAHHLAAFRLPATCQRLYIAADGDAAGRHGLEGLSRTAKALGVLPLVLSPELGDFNEDLRRLGASRMADNLRQQLLADDAATFLSDIVTRR
ncbi:toprim domain-containing protein [Rhizobium sp. BK418]|uniref:DUF7146 domain-containing protein n=1 Tax=Rhizobium sp. BK418 TaxID=2512120 RepID=UPI00104F538A|nr:toprim domain-containing protein [Rhizobium sp. BK418]TCR94792.1 Toprim domain-containing protein [Rhizobium sp. BK418]